MNIVKQIQTFLPNSRIALYALTDRGAYQLKGPDQGFFTQEQALVIAKVNPDLDLVASGELPETSQGESA